MPDVKKHCAITRERTGYGFGKLHEWIDKDARTTGVDHRKERHYFNLEDQKAIKDYWAEKKGKRWAEKAVVEWLFHIALDNLETAYKLSLNESSYGRKTFNCIKIVFKRSGYIDCSFERLADE